MAILSTNQKLIKVSVDYSAGNGIDITSGVISVTGDNAPYSAGDNIDIQDHIISGKDWSNDIEQASANAYNVTTAWVQDNYANSADMTYISAMVDTKLDTSAWSSVSGDLATESYVIMADNINYAQATAYVENQNYANKDFVLDNIDSATSGKLDSSSFASVSGDFLTTAFGISESGAWNEATNCVENNSAAWFDNQGDVEVNELVYAQSANWNEVSSKLDSTAFDTWQQGQYTNDIAGLNNLIGTKLDSSSFAEASGNFYPTSNPSGFITGVDLTPYYTTAEANTLSSMLSGAIDFVSANAGGLISSYTTATIEGNPLIISLNDTPINAYRAVSAQEAGIANNAKYDYEGNNLVDDHNSLTSLKDVVQTNSGVWNEVTNKLDSSSFSDVSGTFYTNDNPSGFITGVDLSNYYTKDETSGKEELANAFANIPVGDPEVNAYVTSNSASIDESTDLVQSNSSTWNDVTAYQSNSGIYLTAHQDISNKLDTTAFGTVSGDFLTTGDSSNFAQKSDFTFVTDQWGTYLHQVSGKYIDYATRAGRAELDSDGHLITTQYFTTANANTLSSMFSAAIDYVSANAGGTTLTGDAQGAVNNVYSNSSKYVLNNATAVAIGYSNTATSNSFAQGDYNRATTYSLAQGYSCTANNYSNAQGIGNSASKFSQAFGCSTMANNSGMAIGSLNKTTTAAFVIGNGDLLTDTRSDCFIIDHNGNVSACGKISANGVELGGGDLSNYATTSQLNTASSFLSGAIDYVSANAGGTDYYETAVTSTQDFVVEQPGQVQSGDGNLHYSNIISTIYKTNDIVATALGLENLNNAKIYANFSNVTSYNISYPAIYLSGTLNGNNTYGGWNFNNTAAFTAALLNGINLTDISSRGDVSKAGNDIPDNILGVYFITTTNNSTITAKTVPFTASITSPGTTISLTSLYDSIPETSGFVPLSSFNELKQSYDALSSLFATYSGQWLLPNEGV